MLNTKMEIIIKAGLTSQLFAIHLSNILLGTAYQEKIMYLSCHILEQQQKILLITSNRQFARNLTLLMHILGQLI